MLERFVKEARDVAADAHDQARARGSSTVEAEHVLLALARDSTGRAGEVLARAGLDHAAVVSALESEFETTLAAVGVSVAALGAPPPTVPFAGRPRFGASATGALERALEVARDRGDRRIESAHILLGLLKAREGTVPRALRGAGVDPAALAADRPPARDVCARRTGNGEGRRSTPGSRTHVSPSTAPAVWRSARADSAQLADAGRREDPLQKFLVIVPRGRAEDARHALAAVVLEDAEVALALQEPRQEVALHLREAHPKPECIEHRFVGYRPRRRTKST